MSRQRYPEEFKIEAVKQVTEKANLSPRSPSAWACPCTAFTPGSRSTASPKSSVNKTTISRPNCVSYALNSSA